MHKRDVKRFDVPSPLSLVNTSFSSTQSSLPFFASMRLPPSSSSSSKEKEREERKEREKLRARFGIDDGDRGRKP